LGAKGGCTTFARQSRSRNGMSMGCLESAKALMILSHDYHVAVLSDEFEADLVHRV